MDNIGSNIHQGTAYVFVRSGSTWTQRQELTASDGETGDEFGYDVSIYGTNIIVGAPLKDSQTAIDDGAAYIFLYRQPDWVQFYFFHDNNGYDGNKLGSLVSVSDNGNTYAIGAETRVFVLGGQEGGGDGVFATSTGATVAKISLSGDGDTLAIGEIRAACSVFACPSARTSVYVRVGRNWSLQQSLFDTCIPAISSDTIVTANCMPSGRLLNAISVFVRSGPVWSLQATLEPQASTNSDEFGSAVALSTGVNGSGEIFYRAVVGVPKADVGVNSDQGEVWVFESTNQGEWSLNARLNPNDRASGDQFGYSVDISGDTIVAGSLLDDVNANSNQGSAYVFAFNGTTWTQQQKLTASDGALADLFGRSVGISGDTIVVGADLDNVGPNADQGSAYVFKRSGTTWTQQQKLIAPDGMASDEFGFSVGISGDTIIAGALNDQVGSNFSQGSAYEFTRTGNTWTQQQKLTASDGSANDNFGNAVAISNNTVIIGAYFDDVGAPNDDKGSAYIFTRTGTVWSQAQKLTASDGTALDNFGSAVAIDTDTAIVGTPGSDISGNPDQGAAYVFTRSPVTSVWSERQKLTAGDGADFDGFGNAVAVIGQVLVIGASLDDLGSVPNAGSAYIFAAVPANSIWTGAIGSNWQTDTNWVSNLAPSTLDDATLPESGVTNEAVISAADVSLNNLTIAAGRQLTINAGRTLTVNGNLTLNGTIGGSGTLIFNGANLTNNNFISNVSVQFGAVDGAQQLAGTGMFLGNTITVLSGSTLQLVTNHTINRIVVSNGGTLNLPSINILSLLGPGVALANNGSVTGTGAVSFEGTSTQSTSGNIAFPNLTINNSAGVVLGADSTVNGVLNLASGDVNTGSFALTMPATATSTGTRDVVGNVTRTGFTTVNTLSFGNPFNTIGFTSGTPPSDVMVNLVKQTPIDFINAVRRTYTITPTGGSGYSAKVRLHYQDADLNGNTKPTLGLWRKGAAWTNLGATTRNATDNWVELVGVTQFSTWTISGLAAPICGYVVMPASKFFTTAGGAGSLNITTSSSCSWTASASDSWITITSTNAGAGNFVLTYEVRENFTGSARQAYVSVSGTNQIVVQDGGLGEGCGYSISPTFQSFPAGGGSGTTNVVAAQRCAWQTVASVPWITITSSGVGIGNGTVSYSVAANSSAGGRKGTITIGGQVFGVKQKGS